MAYLVSIFKNGPLEFYILLFHFSALTPSPSGRGLRRGDQIKGACLIKPPLPVPPPEGEGTIIHVQL